MANHHTAWHVLFVAGLSEHGPPGFEILPEFVLSKEPLRADVVVVRRGEGPRHDEEARTLRHFWPHVRDTALIEFKTLSRPLRPGEVAKLFGYGGQYHALCVDRLTKAEGLLLVLVVPKVTPTLVAELESLRLKPVPVGRGYARAEGHPYDLLVIDLSAVVDADRDELMAIFVQNTMLTLFATRFMEHHQMTTSAPKNISELEDYDAVVRRWLSALTPAKRLEGLAPAERLEGLAPAEQVLALSDEVLRGFTDEYLRSLPAEVQAAVRQRIGRPA